MNFEWIHALCGGALIGVAVSLMLLWTGRVAGISGIFYGMINPQKGDIAWRACFLGGLMAGGLTLHFLMPDTFGGLLPTDDWTVITAGVLVGFGTALGSGCTSGHGVCGVSRVSTRSLVATVLFVGSGIFSVVVLRAIGVLP